MAYKLTKTYTLHAFISVINNVMQQLIFTEEYCRPQNLHPFTLTRHIQDIRVGIITIREKWERMLQLTSFDKWEGYYLDDERSVKIDAVGNKSCLMIHANVLPTVALVQQLKKLKHGEVLMAGDEGAIAYKFSGKEVKGLNNIKMLRAVPFKDAVTVLRYPWQIFQFNAAALKADFALLTMRRRSKVLSKTNKVIGRRSNIFVEAGAQIEHCILNVTEGPIYIGKNAVVMEGGMIKGPFAIGDNGVVKMGSKIYGATTIGPGCIAGGEIKNSVMMAYSNKAHDGYLGDSVIGEWCNLGAGTSNSNIKNNCGEVTYWVHADKKEMSAGTKGGLLMGDYSKVAINTSFNTGTVMGVCSNVFTPGLTPKYIPHFSWGADGITKYKLSKALADINRWKQLKGQAITEKEKNILTHIYNKF
jgi:UDP-N-acetylglucosamine diphosphorylase / glucose-1-phosphate thymidylyltransferase / UDP-N-acetylgalactosamine diphosphorylase / glucosamine-1-phosphate N-acetyltransferase / galactosamine-1-phosphate N-acetyltransferase